MGIIGRLKSLADGSPLFWRHFRLLSSESAHHMRGNTLILILIIKKGGVCSLHDIAQIGTHCSVTGDKFKNKEGRCQHNDTCGDKMPEHSMVQFHDKWHSFG